MTYYGYYPPPPPEANRREKKLRVVALAYVGLVVLVAVGVAVYVMLQRLETDVLTAIATIGCASAITLANLTLALMAFLRARERQANGQASALMTPPQVVVIPPMQVQTPPLLPQGQGAPLTQVETVKPRHFTVVGEDSP
jgi:flagellar basal body-associated protein FliL